MPRWLTELPAQSGGETGGTAVEYSLLVVLIAAVIVVAVALLGQKVSNLYQSVNAQFS